MITDNPILNLLRIEQAHQRNGDTGTATGDCVECGLSWPCPTNVWASCDRDPLAAWDPDEDDPVTLPGHEEEPGSDERDEEEEPA